MLPIYELKISENIEDDSEVNFVALVDKPAIEKNFLAFDEQKQHLAFAISNEDKRIISGPLMIAQKPIYRNDDNGEYYIKFSADTIKQIAIKYAKKGFQNNVNLMHDSGAVVTGLTLFESFICDTERGIMPMQGFEDVTNGSWFGSFYVENEEVWNDVKAGKFKGFSVEGLFKYKPTQTEMTAEMAADEILTLLNQTNEDFDSCIIE